MSRLAAALLGIAVLAAGCSSGDAGEPKAQQGEAAAIPAAEPAEAAADAPAPQSAVPSAAGGAAAVASGVETRRSAAAPPLGAAPLKEGPDTGEMAPPRSPRIAKLVTATKPATAAAPSAGAATTLGSPGMPASIKLGGVFPLSGPLGGVGTAMMQGVQSVLTEVNARGGVNGTRLDLVVADDQFDPVRGKALVQRLISQDKVFAFAGIFSPFTTQAALPDIRAARIPVVSPSGSDDREFDEPMLFPVTNPCGRQMAGNVQHLVRERKLTKLAVVYLNVEAVRNCTAQFTETAKMVGSEVVFSGATAPAAPDCASRVLAARASGAQALIVITDNLGTVKCLQARKQQGWDVPVSISYNNVDDPTILRGLGPAAEGVLSSSPFSGAASPAFADQCGAITRYYPDSRLQFFSTVGCLGTKLLVEGLRAAGPDRQALIAALESGRSFRFGDLVPELTYAPGRHLPYDLTATVEVRNGRWTRVGKLYTPVSGSNDTAGSAGQAAWRTAADGKQTWLLPERPRAVPLPARRAVPAGAR